MQPARPRHALVIIALALPGLLLSCKRSSSGTEGGVVSAAASASEAPVASAPASADAPAPTDAPSTPAAQCRMTLRVGSISSSGGITDPDLHSGSTATLVFPCAGGPASAQFGKHMFSGTADKTKVQLTAGSTYKAFGCPWNTVQTISGAPPNLHYNYTEHVAGTCKSSARPSTMSGSVTAG